MNAVFVIAVVGCCVAALLTGNAEGLSKELLAAGENAVTLAFTLAGAYMIWCGLLNVLSQTGLMQSLSRWIQPVCTWLLGAEAKDADVSEAVSTNIIADVLGLGNAATPAGLAAMRGMARRNKEPEKLTYGMGMFILINASCLQVIPTTVVSLRAAAGAAEPAAIFLPCVIGSVVATMSAVLIGKLWLRGRKEG